MCAECGCYGSVVPYGIGGRDVNAKPTPVDLKKVTVNPDVWHKNPLEDVDDEE